MPVVSPRLVALWSLDHLRIGFSRQWLKTPVASPRLVALEPLSYELALHASGLRRLVASPSLVALRAFISCVSALHTPVGSPRQVALEPLSPPYWLGTPVA
jgi:hypothetical protein